MKFILKDLLYPHHFIRASLPNICLVLIFYYLFIFFGNLICVFFCNFSYLVLTTSGGIMDHEEARRKHLGGKILGFFF